MNSGAIEKYTQIHKNDDSKTYQDGLKNIAYDLLYGDKYASDGENPYKRTDIKFGLHDVQVKSVTPMYDEDGTVYIYGKYFTSYSKVYINDEKQDTEYIDPNTLCIKDYELKSGDKLSVYQQNSDDHVLSKTEPYTFTDGELKQKNKINVKTKTTKKSKKSNKKSGKNNK